MSETLSNRVASAGVLMGLAAVLALCLGLVLFVLDMRSLASRAVDSERELRATLLDRCEQRVAYDERFVEAAGNDAELYAELLRIAGSVELPADVDDERRDAYEAQMRAITQARDRKLAIVAEGVLSNCEELQGRPGTSTREAVYP